MPHWIVQGDAQGRWSETMYLHVDTSLAESRTEKQPAGGGAGNAGEKKHALTWQCGKGDRSGNVVSNCQEVRAAPGQSGTPSSSDIHPNPQTTSADDQLTFVPPL